MYKTINMLFFLVFNVVFYKEKAFEDSDMFLKSFNLNNNLHKLY